MKEILCSLDLCDVCRKCCSLIDNLCAISSCKVTFEAWRVKRQVSSLTFRFK